MYRAFKMKEKRYCLQQEVGIMYIISFLAVAVLSWYITDIGSAGNMLWIFDNLPLTLVMLLFIFTLLLAAGLLKDFNNAFRFSIRRKVEKESLNEWRRAIEALRLARKTAFFTGMFLLFFNLSQALILEEAERLKPLGSFLADGLRIPLYASAMILILLPVESSLKLRLKEAQESDTSEKE